MAENKKTTIESSWFRLWLHGETGESMELQPLSETATPSSLPPADEETSTFKLVGGYYSGVSQQDDDSGPHHQTSSIRKAERRSTLEEVLFPSETPQEVQLFRLENIAIPTCYLVVGMMQGLFRTFLNVYPLDLGASEAQQTTFASIATLPAAFKIIYGFTTDNLPLAGYRRKPYLILGWLGASGSMLALMSTSNLTFTDHDLDNRPIPPEDAPSMLWLSVAFFLFGICMWFADATADALVAEKARREPEAMKGSMQSSCYASRFFGLMVMAPVSTWLYSHVGPQSVVRLLSSIPLVMVPLGYLLAEQRDVAIQSTADQCREIWNTVCMRSVWQPMAFVYLFNLLQVSNAAWRQFLRSVLGFTPSELNSLLVASYVLLYTGTLVYKYFFLSTSWRHIYQTCILLNGLFSGLQLLLIRGMTFGLSPFVFALGDDAFAEFLSGIQFLPLAIMMVALCPPGSEGASYAMFTTVWNSAQMLSPAISSVLLGIWDTSKESLEAGELDGLFKLSILTTLIQVSPIFFLGLLPHGRQELNELSEKPLSGSPVGGGIFLGVLFCSMAWTFAVAILNIVKPGWAGGS